MFCEVILHDMYPPGGMLHSDSKRSELQLSGHFITRPGQEAIKVHSPQNLGSPCDDENGPAASCFFTADSGLRGRQAFSGHFE